MAFRYSLKHHPAAAQDFSDSRAWFAEIDKDLAELFASDFQTALRGIASGKLRGQLYAAGHAPRWVKLRRFSHKVFFEAINDDTIFILAVISGRRHPTRIRTMLSRRRKAK